jgi:hypothetical protein
METLSPKEINQYDSYALSAIIDYYKSYDYITVLNTYLLLKKREYVFSEKLSKKIKLFCANHNQDDIDSFCKKEEANLFNFQKIKIVPPTYSENLLRDENYEFEYNAKNKTSYNDNLEKAGLNLKNIVYSMILIMLITPTTFYLMSTAETTVEVSRFYIFLIIVNLVWLIYVMTCIYKAGDYLTKHKLK